MERGNGPLLPRAQSRGMATRACRRWGGGNETQFSSFDLHRRKLRCNFGAPEVPKQRNVAKTGIDDHSIEGCVETYNVNSGIRTI